MQMNDKSIVQVSVRAMTEEDYEEVYRLWRTIKGFGIRSMDDSREGIERFLRRNPTTSMVAEAEGEIVGAGTMAAGAVSTMYVCGKITGSRELASRWLFPRCVPCKRSISTRYA